MTTINFSELEGDVVLSVSELNGLIIEGTPPEGVEYYLDYSNGRESNTLRITDTATGHSIYFNSISLSFREYSQVITFTDNGITSPVILEDGLAQSLAQPTAGNTLIVGSIGDDVVKNSSGDQVIMGRGGSDTYSFGLGDGNDEVFALRSSEDTATLNLRGLNSSDVTITYEASTLEGATPEALDLVVTINSSQESIRFWVVNGGDSSSALKLDRIIFEDGTVIDLHSVGPVIDFASGNETSSGSDSDDTFIFTAGDDKDAILISEEAPGGFDVLKINGYGSDDLILTRVDEQVELFGSSATIGNLIINFKGDTDVSDQITIQGFFNDDLAQQIFTEIEEDDVPPEIADFYQYIKDTLNPIEQIEFEDGTVLSSADISELLNAPALNIFNGTEGVDDFSGSLDADEINGLGGNDVLRGREGNDVINGGEGDDRLFGNAGNDILFGDSGRDVLNGGDGDDILTGGSERDVLIGGTGNDTFVFDAELVSSQSNVLRDFTLGDMIALDQDIFSSLNIGSLSSDNFVSGAGAVSLDADDHLIYNTTNGRLSYDADGIGSGSAVVVAILQNDYDLSATDISVI